MLFRYYHNHPKIRYYHNHLKKTLFRFCHNHLKHFCSDIITIICKKISHIITIISQHIQILSQSSQTFFSEIITIISKLCYSDIITIISQQFSEILSQSSLKKFRDYHKHIKKHVRYYHNHLKTVLFRY